MNRTMPALARRAVGALALSGVLVVAGACGGDEPTATQSQPTTTPVTEAPPPGVVPANTVVPVPVTKPAAPQAVDPATLPDAARAAGQTEGLQPTEKTCVDYTIAQTLKADPSIEATDGKLQGLMGEAVVTCAGAPRTATLVVAQLGKPELMNNLTDADKACFVKALGADAKGLSALLASTLTYNPLLIIKAAEPFDSKCAPAKLVSQQFSDMAKGMAGAGTGG